jgi:hypothetical protein
MGVSWNYREFVFGGIVAQGVIVGFIEQEETERAEPDYISCRFSKAKPTREYIFQSVNWPES